MSGWVYNFRVIFINIISLVPKDGCVILIGLIIKSIYDCVHFFSLNIDAQHNRLRRGCVLLSQDLINYNKQANMQTDF
jgi:hypothetical protein